MTPDSRSPHQVNRIDELPASLRSALIRALRPREELRLLIYSPAFTEEALVVHAGILAVSDRGWHMLTDMGNGFPSVDGSDFADTVLLELSEEMFYGRLKIDFIAGGSLSSACTSFNTLEAGLYRRAITMILNGIEPPPQMSASHEVEAATAGWPDNFQSLAMDYAQGQGVLGAIWWPPIYGGFNRELAPGAAILLTDRQIVLISEPKARPWEHIRPEQRLGAVATYYPRARLFEFEISRHMSISVLSLSMHASHGGEKLDILIASQKDGDIEKLMEKAVARKLV